MVHLRTPIHLCFLSPPVHSGYAFEEVEVGAALKVASMIMPRRIVIPRVLMLALTISKKTSSTQ
jgi:hypothetical protein